MLPSRQHNFGTEKFFLFPKKLFISLQVTSKLSSKSLLVELENLMPTDKLFLLIISDAAAALVVVAVIVVVAAVVIAVAAAASKETSMRISGSDKLTFCSKSMKKVKLGRIFDVSVQKDLSFSERYRSRIRSFLTRSQQP